MGDNARGPAEDGPPQYRFQVGDRVEANVGSFHPGTVVSIGYREAHWPPEKTVPYQIRLDEGPLIYAPFDEDRVVRAMPGHFVLQAAKAEDPEAMMEALLGAGEDGLDTPDEEGKTALVVAAGASVEDVALQLVGQLVAAGASVNASDFEGNYPLHAAVRNSYRPVAKLLLDNGANIDCQSLSLTEYMGGNWHIVDGDSRYLEDAEKADKIRSVDNLDATPLMVALEEGDEGMAEFLLEGGADVNVRGAAGKNALHVALEEGLMGIAGALLEKGADAMAGHKEMHGTLLHHYAGRGRVPYLKLLLRYVPQGAVDAQENMRGMTPLHLAAQRGKVPVCSLLIASGASKTIQNADGKTAEDLARINGHTGVVELLDAA